MGLDMYLVRKVYIGGDYEHRDVSGSVDITIYGKKVDISLNEISEITSNIGYWRKANHVHKWFVDNVQGGEDDCQEHGMDIKQLLELKEVCKKVLDNKSLAEELLPTETGFFFGGTDYDEYYFQDLEDTIKIIEKCEQHKEDNFYYHSSW